MTVINNVSRKLLADLLGNDHDKRIMAERHLLAMLANAPSPAGADAVARITAAPVQQAEYGDAYQGAREDLAIWKRRALEAEKALQEERIITERQLSALKAQEPVAEIAFSDDGYKIGLLGALRNHRLPIGTKLYAAPVSEAKAQGVVMPDGWRIRECEDVDADLKGFIISSPLMDGERSSNSVWHTDADPAHKLLYEMLASLDEVARLNATHVQPPKCRTCDDNGLIGGPSFYSPDEGGEPCPDCCSPVQQVSVPQCVFDWFEAKQAHVNAVDAYNARLAFVREHMPFGTSVDPEYQIMEEAGRKVRNLVWPMFSGLRDLAAAPAAYKGAKP